MMDFRENVEAILGTCFSGYKIELIEAATDRICSIKMKENPLYRVKADGSIEPLQITGKWIHHEDIIGLGGYYRCSCCNERALYFKADMEGVIR